MTERLIKGYLHADSISTATVVVKNPCSNRPVGRKKGEGGSTGATIPRKTGILNDVCRNGPQDIVVA